MRGKVYDVTKWMYDHPGGVDTILLAAGRDATQVFETYHKLSTEQQLSKFLIGTLITDELPTFPPMSKFHRTLKQRIDDYFKKTGKDPKDAVGMRLRYLTIFVTIILSFAGQIIYAPVNFPLAMLLALVLGLCCALIGLLPMHDGSHFSITHNPNVWRALGATHDFVNGASYLIWLYQHMLGHHPYTNIEGADPDIVTSEKDIRRIKMSQKWYHFYIYQHIYVPLVYIFLGLKTRYQDIYILHFLKMNGDIRLNPPSTYHLTVFWAGKIFFVLYRFILPSFFLPWWQIIVLFLISDAMTSYWLAILFQANHVANGVKWPKAVDGKVDMDWAEMQVVTTQDYAHGSWFWTTFSGGLNYQVTHHLFPGVLQYHYREVGKIVRETCDEFKVPYIVQPTALAAIKSHIGYLEKLGRENNEEKEKLN